MSDGLAWAGLRSIEIAGNIPLRTGTHGTPQQFRSTTPLVNSPHVWLARLDPVAAGKPVVERLHRQTPVCILELASPHVLSMRGVGPIQRLVSSTSGKTILAHADAPEIDAALRALERSRSK